MNLNILINKIDNTCHVTQAQAIRSVSRSLTIRNWIIGYYIVEYEQNGEYRAAYGDKLIVNISKKLSHIQGMSTTNLKLFKLFYLSYPQISQTVSDEFKLEFQKSQTVSDKSLFVPVHKLLRVCTFSHFVELIKVDEVLKRTFYEVETIKSNWSVRELKRQINSQIYERMGLSQDKGQLIESINDKSEVLLPLQIIKDPYILEFTGLEQKVKYSENDLETALLNNLQDFLLELGNGFTFVERQKRMIIDGDDHNLDLLFYHRKLKRLVAIELKIDKFKAKYKGQMELYLKWLNKYEKQEGEQTPIGLILCAVASKEQIELLEIHKDGIMVAEYWTELPPKEILEAKLHEALIEARERIERKQLRQ